MDNVYIYAINVWEYVLKVFDQVKIGLGAAMSVGIYLFFPSKTLLISLGAVLIAASFDVITKFYCISCQVGGYKKAVKIGAIWSKTLWQLTEIKIVSYLVISLLVGLSYRVLMFDAIPKMLGSFVYSMMFLREFQSIVENLIGAGADLEWLLLFAKNKEKHIINKHNQPVKEEDKDEL